MYTCIQSEYITVSESFVVMYNAPVPFFLISIHDPTLSESTDGNLTLHVLVFENKCTLFKSVVANVTVVSVVWSSTLNPAPIN